MGETQWSVLFEDYIFIFFCGITITGSLLHAYVKDFLC